MCVLKSAIDDKNIWHKYSVNLYRAFILAVKAVLRHYAEVEILRFCFRIDLTGDNFNGIP